LKYESIIHKTKFRKSSSATDAAFSHLTLAQFSSEGVQIATIDGLGSITGIDLYGFHSSPDPVEIKHQRTILTIDPIYSTLVPNSIFTQKKAADFLNFQIAKTPQEMVVLTETVSELDATLVYGIDAHLAAFAENIFQEVKIHSSSKGLLSYWKLLHTNHQKPITCIHIENNQLLISCWRKNELLFFTTQETQQVEDVIYHVLYSLDQLSEEFNQLPLVWSTSISSKTFAEKAIEILKSYHSHIEPLTGFDKQQINQLDPSIQIHQSAKLISSLLCE
tara:strand:- start:490 stop:1320 length:831 start_codon:yes stop_codon:yes gene_type:complete